MVNTCNFIALNTQELKAQTGIDLENIVYYKDDTHYFVMTAKKDSLLKKGVLKAVRWASFLHIKCLFTYVILYCRTTQML